MLTDCSPNLGLSCSSLGELTFCGSIGQTVVSEKLVKVRNPCTMSKISAFEQANLGNVPVYITKGEKLQGSCVEAPYQVTRSSLFAFVLSHGTGDVVVTDIAPKTKANL